MQIFTLTSFAAILAAVNAIPVGVLEDTHNALTDKRSEAHPVVLGYKRDSGAQVLDDKRSEAHPVVLGYKRHAGAAENIADVHVIAPEDANLPDGTVVPTYGCPKKIIAKSKV